MSNIYLQKVRRAIKIGTWKQDFFSVSPEAIAAIGRLSFACPNFKRNAQNCFRFLLGSYRQKFVDNYALAVIARTLFTVYSPQK